MGAGWEECQPVEWSGAGAPIWATWLAGGRACSTAKALQGPLPQGGSGSLLTCAGYRASLLALPFQHLLGLCPGIGP